MEASIHYEGLDAYGTTRYRVPVGKFFIVTLTDAPHAMKWFADNDDVLNIDVSEGGLSAIIHATEVGKSEIQLQGRGPHLDLTIHVEVYQPGTTTVEATFGNVRLKP